MHIPEGKCQSRASEISKPSLSSAKCKFVPVLNLSLLIVSCSGASPPVYESTGRDSLQVTGIWEEMRRKMRVDRRKGHVRSGNAS